MARFRVHKNHKTKSQCERVLRQNIRKEMRHYNAGEHASREQALAIAFSKTRRKSPSCAKAIGRKRALSM